MEAVNFEEYIHYIPEKLSKVKFLILKTLWYAGEEFPKEWVRSSELLSLTNQKYFDRRIRELRDQSGCDIQTDYYHGEYCYRLHSTNLNQYNPRFYLSTSLKNKLFEMFKYECNVCKRRFLPGGMGLQADHREPLSRKILIKNDVNNLEKWQSLCTECNVLKRRICSECDNDCGSCPWAYPEKHGTIILLRLPTNLEDELKNRGVMKHSQLESFIVNSIIDSLSTKKTS